jgi:hypothetical protein
MTRYKNLPSYSFVIKRRGRLWVWFPESLEPMCASLPFREIRSVRLCAEGDHWRLESQLKKGRIEIVARFDQQKQGKEAFNLISKRLLKKRQGRFYNMLAMLAILVIGLVLVSLFLSEPEEKSRSLSSQGEKLSSPPEKSYGVPIEAHEFLERMGHNARR